MSLKGQRHASLEQGHSFGAAAIVLGHHVALGTEDNQDNKGTTVYVDPPGPALPALGL